MNRIKIVYLISSLANEGPVNVMYNIIKYIDYSKFEVSIITLIPEKTNTKIDEFTKLPIKIYQLAKEKKVGVLTSYLSLREKCKEIRPDILHGHCSRPLYLMSFLPKKIKKVYTIHVSPGLQNIILSGKYKGHVVIALDNFFTRRCDLPICCSESISEFYLENKGWDFMSIPNGASLPVWEYNKNDKYKIREELGLKNNVKYFIFIGRFSKEKNPDKLTDAFKMLSHRHDIGLIMLGTGPSWDDLNAIKTSNVIMPGFTTAVYDFLKASDYYISASDIEGLANTLLESMSVGLPMLLSDIPSHKEVISNSSAEALGSLFHNGEISNIVSKIEEILLYDYNIASLNLKKLYRKKYTAEIMSENYQKAYRRLSQSINFNI